MDHPIRLFVYGTLMPDEPLWPALAPYAASWGPATARRLRVDTSAGAAFAYEWLGSTDGFEPLPGGWPAR